MHQVVPQPPRPSPDHEQFLDQDTMRLVHRKARQLIGKFGFTSSDRDDLQQELVLALLERHEKFDPAKSHKLTFVFRVLNNKITEIVRHRNREKCDLDQGIVSLHARVVDGDGRKVETVDTLAANTLHNRSRIAVRSDQEQMELRLDVAVVVGALAAEQRDLCRRLQQSSLAEICRDLNISRRALGALLAHLRERFVAAGLQEKFLSRICARSLRKGV